jgi:hypothetical protein
MGWPTANTTLPGEIKGLRSGPGFFTLYIKDNGCFQTMRGFNDFEIVIGHRLDMFFKHGCFPTE